MLTGLRQRGPDRGAGVLWRWPRVSTRWSNVEGQAHCPDRINWPRLGNSSRGPPAMGSTNHAQEPSPERPAPIGRTART